MKSKTLFAALAIMLCASFAAAGVIDGERDNGKPKAVSVTDEGYPRVEPFRHSHIDTMDATTGWTVLGNDTINLAVTTNHVEGTYALEFDKVDGAANTKLAGIQKTITACDIQLFIESNGFMNGNFYVSALTDVDYIFMRAGTDSSNYTEWRVLDDDASTDWNLATVSITTPAAVVGNGMIHTAVAYVALGVAFDAETDTLADIAFDHIGMIGGQTITITLATTTNVSTPNVNLHRVSGTPTVTDHGPGTAGVQRIASALLDFEADEPANCVAITDTSAQFTMPASEMFEICASGGTAYVLCNANPTATTTVTTGFSLVVQDGQCHGPMIINEAKCAVIGAVTVGNLCFKHME